MSSKVKKYMYVGGTIVVVSMLGACDDDTNEKPYNNHYSATQTTKSDIQCDNWVSLSNGEEICKDKDSSNYGSTYSNSNLSFIPIFLGNSFGSVSPNTYATSKNSYTPKQSKTTATTSRVNLDKSSRTNQSKVDSKSNTASKGFTSSSSQSKSSYSRTNRSSNSKTYTAKSSSGFKSGLGSSSSGRSGG